MMGTSHAVVLYSKSNLLTKLAHIMSNPATNVSQAVFALKADARWAVTGTPFQNRLSDLATIFQFLRVHPYDDPKTFGSDVIQVWRMGSDRLALDRLKRLLRYVLLRRATGILQLPKRNDLKVTLQLRDEERAHYQTIERNVVNSIDTALNNSATTQSTLNVLRQINELRMICDQGTHRSLRQAQASQPRGWNSQAAERAFETLTATGSMLCSKCGFDIDTVGDAMGLGFNLPSHICSPYMHSCLRVFCAACVEQHDQLSCGHEPICAKALIRLKPGESRSAASTPSTENTAVDAEPLPTKIQALVEDLQSLPKGHKRCVSHIKIKVWQVAVRGG
jgi:SWI/SNF-related matrix-associated actin-dependent regulator of chromatin subfamily A3